MVANETNAGHPVPCFVNPFGVRFIACDVFRVSNATRQVLKRQRYGRSEVIVDSRINGRETEFVCSKDKNSQVLSVKTSRNI